MSSGVAVGIKALNLPEALVVQNQHLVEVRRFEAPVLQATLPKQRCRDPGDARIRMCLHGSETEETNGDRSKPWTNIQTLESDSCSALGVA